MIPPRQDYVYPSVKDRQFLHYFYKGAKKQAFSVQKYNRLKEEVALVSDGGWGLWGGGAWWGRGQWHAFSRLRPCSVRWRRTFAG